LRNPLGFLFEKKSSYELSDPRLQEIFGHAPTLSGVSIGPESALRVPAVNAAIRVIAESIASLPINILKDDGASKVVDKKHPLFRIVHDEPNAWSSSYDFRLQMMTDVLLHGNAYAFVNRVGGTVREVIRLLPTSVSVAVDVYSYEPTYSIRDSKGGIKECSYTEIIHLKALSTNGAFGIAPILHAREAIALAMALEAHAARLMGNAGRPSGILKVKGKLTQTIIDRIRVQWSQGQSGNAAGGTAIFDTDTDFSPLTFNSVDLQFSEMRKFQIEEISRAFRVPLHLLSELGRVTWANASELGQNFLDYTLNPWIINIQGAMTMALLTPEERVNTFIEIDVSALTRANLQVRSESYLRSVGGPWQTADEVRALENMPPIPGGNVLNEPQGVGTPSLPTDQPNLAKSSKFNPDQPRDPNGRFGSGGQLGPENFERVTGTGRSARAEVMRVGLSVGLSTLAGAIKGGLTGAALGAAVSVFVESGAANYVGETAIAVPGPHVLPDWAHEMLVAHHAQFNGKSAYMDSFLASLSEAEMKRLCHDMIESLDDDQIGRLANALVPDWTAANDNGIPQKVAA
jgi:HK97 family phage portal protein